jgi:signal transduction histidine kinase
MTKEKEHERALIKARENLEIEVEEKSEELRHANKLLEEKVIAKEVAEKALLEQQKRLRLLASELSLAEERERRRIASEVHDNIGQTLALAKIKLGTMRLDKLSTEQCSNMDETLILLNTAIEDTRRLVTELGLPILDELGLIEALRWLSEQTQKVTGLVVEFADDRRDFSVSDDARIMIFQAVKELLTNAAKHSQAKFAKISVKRVGNNLRIEVADDGVGFDVSAIESNKSEFYGFGLFSIEQRLAALQGNMICNSQVGEGTTVILSVPLQA